MKEKSIWIFDDGARRHECASFPFAYKFMYNVIRKAIENKQNPSLITGRYRIEAPFGKVYTYTTATELAKASGLLTLDGTLEQREFKKRRS